MRKTLLQNTPCLAALSVGLNVLDHVRRLRIRSHLTVLLPEHIDQTLLDWAEQLQLPLTLVIHSNHIQELDNSVAQALAEGLFEHGVLPYYLHQLDPVQGAAHFAVSDQKALSLHQQMRERLPGYLLPELVREIPGQASKTPLKTKT